MRLPFDFNVLDAWRVVLILITVKFVSSYRDFYDANLVLILLEPRLFMWVSCLGFELWYCFALIWVFYVVWYSLYLPPLILDIPASQPGQPEITFV